MSVMGDSYCFNENITVWIRVAKYEMLNIVIVTSSTEFHNFVPNGHHIFIILSYFMVLNATFNNISVKS